MTDFKRKMRTLSFRPKWRKKDLSSWWSYFFIVTKSLRLGFEVENLNNLIEKLRRNEINILKEPKKSEFGYFAIIEDLDGRKIELKENP